MLPELIRMYPNIDVTPPHGDGNQRSSYMHLVIIMLEWQALENLLGTDRARAVMDFKRQDHYKDMYATVIAHRPQMEGFLTRSGVKW